MVPVPLCINYVGSQNVSLENVRWVTHVITTLVFVCPWSRIYWQFSFKTAADFLTSAEFLHGRKHHEQNSNLELPPRKATGSSFFLDCCRSTLSAILTSQYIVIGAHIFQANLSWIQGKYTVWCYRATAQRLWQACSVGCFRMPSFFSSIVPSRPDKDRAQSRPGLFLSFYNKSSGYRVGRGLKPPRLSSISPHSIAARDCSLRQPIKGFVAV